MDKNKLILSLLAALVGLLMLVIPNAFLALIIVILGVAAIVDGVFILFTTRNLIIDPQYKMIMTIRGIISVVIGFLAISIPMIFATVVWQMMAYMLGIYLLVSSIMEAYCITKLHRNGIMIKQSVMEVVISVILAIVLFIIPAETAGNIIIRICGFILLVVGGVIAFLQWRNRPIVGFTEPIIEEVEE